MEKIKYFVRSRALLDIVNDVKRGRLIISPYFQRNLVWRTIHKMDFIKTILCGYPFPEIFISRGKVDIESMETISCIVDGQQRINSIMEFIGNAFSIDDKYYEDLSLKEKEHFLKYEISIIDLDLDENDPEIKEIFKRLNRTFYSLSSIEKLATEYAPSEFMLVAKLLAKELNIEHVDNEDPNIPDEFFVWGRKHTPNTFHELILDNYIFSSYEISRKVHLQFVLNLNATIIGGIFNRSSLSNKYLDDFADSFEDKETILKTFNDAASLYLRCGFKRGSYWFNKANAFSLLILFYNNINKFDNSKIKIYAKQLNAFEKDLPEDYKLSAKEAVNNKKERLIRNSYLQDIVDQL
ncbi:DUF262 domain-containing protein [Candidatus Margulisiibacteriota bacterium]